MHGAEIVVKTISYVTKPFLFEAIFFITIELVFPYYRKNLFILGRCTVENKWENVMIIGAGMAGCLVLQTIKKCMREKQPVGFIDDDIKKINIKINGLPVLGNRYDIPRLIKDNDINEIILAMPSAPIVEVGKIIEICQKTNVRLKILASVQDLVTGDIKLGAIRDVQLEDLLERETLALDLNEIAKYLNGKVVLITGAGGSVGSELSRYVADNDPYRLVIMGRGENSIYEIEQKLKVDYPQLDLASEIADIKDRGRIERLFNKHKPSIVFHAAAHKHVPYMEECPEEAVKNNILGTKILCETAAGSGSEKFIFVSTDKAVKPTSIMGATKRVGEIYIQMIDEKTSTKFAAVRFGNILGSRGSVVVKFENQIARGGPLTITHPNMTRYFMTVSEAAQLVIQAGAMAKGGEIFVLDMGKPISIKELAVKMIKLKGLEPGKDIKIKYTGIRPGEKVTESLFGDKEKVLPTRHNKIFKVYKNRCEFENVRKLLETIENPNFSYDEKEAANLLSCLFFNK